jgi:hypothetical protein
MSELFNVNQRLHNFLTKQKEAGGNTTDENRTIGTQATLNNQDVYWSGQNYGWQSQESYDKLKEGPEFRAGHIALSRLGTDVNQAIGMGVDAAPEPVKATVTQTIRQGVQAYQRLPQGIRTGVKEVVDFAGDVNETVSKATNVSPIITGEVLTAGASKVIKGPATVGARQIARAMPEQSVAYGLTIGDPRYLAPGVVQDVSKTQANRTARDYLNQSLKRLDKRRSQLELDVKSGKVEYKSKEWFRLDKKIREERYGESSSFYNRLDQDPPAYRKPGQRHKDPTESAKYLEQHHLAAKAQTAPFVDAMIKVGDADDLVALHEYSRMLGVFMGNGKINMLDAPGPIHRAAAAKTTTEKAGNIHSAFSKVGLEKSNAYVTKLLENANTSDEVMGVFTKYAKEHIIPQQDIAKKIVKKYFEEYRVDLTPSQRSAFDKLVEQANKGT